MSVECGDLKLCGENKRKLCGYEVETKKSLWEVPGLPVKKGMTPASYI